MQSRFNSFYSPFLIFVIPKLLYAS